MSHNDMKETPVRKPIFLFWELWPSSGPQLHPYSFWSTKLSHYLFTPINLKLRIGNAKELVLILGLGLWFQDRTSKLRGWACQFLVVTCTNWQASKGKQEYVANWNREAFPDPLVKHCKPSPQPLLSVVSSLSLNPLFPLLLHVTCLLTSVSLFHFSIVAQKYHLPTQKKTPPKLRALKQKHSSIFIQICSLGRDFSLPQCLGSQFGTETWVCPFSMYGSWLVGSYFSNQEQIGDKTLVFCWRRWSVDCDHWSLS